MKKIYLKASYLNKPSEFCIFYSDRHVSETIDMFEKMLTAQKEIDRGYVLLALEESSEYGYEQWSLATILLTSKNKFQN